MSYSVDLWNSYNKVQNNFMTHLKGLKDFIYMMTDNYNGYSNLVKCIEKMNATPNSFGTLGSLQEGMMNFKGDLMNQVSYLKEFLGGLKDEIVNPMVKLQNTLNQRINLNLNEIANADKMYRNSIYQLEQAKKKFHETAKEAEILKLKCEITKTTANFNPENLKKDEIKSQNLLKEAKENENNYLTIINDTNKIQEDYIEIKKKCLNNIQQMEQELGDNIKDCLRKYIVFQIAYVRNLQYDVEKKARNLEEINIKKDIDFFIISNLTNDIPPYKYEYIPFSYDLEANHKNIDKNILKEVSNFMSNVFTLEKGVEINITKNKLQVEMANITMDLFNNKELKFEDKNLLINLIIMKNNRRLLLKRINNLRLKYGNSLTDYSFRIVGDLLKESLIIALNDTDYFSVILVFSLATSLYKISSESNRPRIFMQNYLIGLEALKKIGFWLKIIKYSIIEEMHNQKNINIFVNNETENERKARLNNLIKQQLNTFIYHMISFEAKETLIEQTIEYFINSVISK